MLRTSLHFNYIYISSCLPYLLSLHMLMITSKPLTKTCIAYCKLIPPPLVSLSSLICHHPLVSSPGAFLQAKIVTSVCHWKIYQLCVRVLSVLFSYFFPDQLWLLLHQRISCSLVCLYSILCVPLPHDPSRLLCIVLLLFASTFNLLNNSRSLWLLLSPFFRLGNFK